MGESGGGDGGAGKRGLTSVVVQENDKENIQISVKQHIYIYNVLLT